MNRILLGFLVAPIIPVFIFSLIAGADDFFIILMIGVAPAYVGALFIGAPLLYVFSKLDWLSWYYFALGGVLCALPFGWFFLGGANTNFEISGLRNMVVFCGIGAAGGIMFWFISVRPNLLVRKSVLRETIGVVGLVLVTLSCAYVYYLGTPKSYEGTMLAQNMEFISSSNRDVEIKLSDGTHVKASLSATLPFRPGCPIYVTSRRSYISADNLYWVDGYKDIPSFYLWPSILERSKKDDIPKSCE